MEPKMASKKVRKSEEGHLGHPRVTEIHKGAISGSFWVHFGVILAPFGVIFGPFSDPFWAIFVNPGKFAESS